MLIRNADIVIADNGARAIRDVRIRGDRIADIGRGLVEESGETVFDAHGAALLPGLNDHHLHIMALAAALDSLTCGPPDVDSAEQLQAKLQAADTAGDRSWLRGIGYHESVAGDIDRHWLDRFLCRRPARIQHRSGRLWILNSLALQALGVEDDDNGKDPCERIDGRLSGRLYDADGWLRERIGSRRPSLLSASRLLASHGITGFTDTSHRNGPEDFAYFEDLQQRGELLQNLVVMGDECLDQVQDRDRIRRGARKFHLHDHDLPDFDTLCTDIRHSHDAGRAVAFHCVSRVDLAFALAALAEAGSQPGDRIEHASVSPPDALEAMKSLGVTVVTQPNFVQERGDVYLEAVEAIDQPWLYRLRSFQEAGIPLAAGSDAPYGHANPWLAMDAAVNRQTARGRPLGADEALSPEAALALFTSPLNQPGAPCEFLRSGSVADCCVLDRSWSEARQKLADTRVRLTLISGLPASKQV